MKELLFMVVITLDIFFIIVVVDTFALFIFHFLWGQMLDFDWRGRGTKGNWFTVGSESRTMVLCIRIVSALREH